MLDYGGGRGRAKEVFNVITTRTEKNGKNGKRKKKKKPYVRVRPVKRKIEKSLIASPSTRREIYPWAGPAQVV